MVGQRVKALETYHLGEVREGISYQDFSCISKMRDEEEVLETAIRRSDCGLMRLSL